MFACPKMAQDSSSPPGMLGDDSSKSKSDNADDFSDSTGDTSAVSGKDLRMMVTLDWYNAKLGKEKR